MARNRYVDVGSVGRRDTGRSNLNWPEFDALGVEAARPAACPWCRLTARDGPRVVLHGHGVRLRPVGIAGADGVVEETVHVRRFLCSGCGRTCSVPSTPVLPRFRYALCAVLLALMLAAATPIGEGLPDGTVYDRVGRCTGGRALIHRRRPRWRSLSRRAALPPVLWPSRPTCGTTGRTQVAFPLVGFIGPGGRERAIGEPSSRTLPAA